MNNMVLNEGVQLTLNENAKDNQRKYNKFLNKTDVVN